MPVHRSDQLTKALTGTYVDNRLINWLWFHIPYKHPTANLGEYKSHGMTDRMADFIIKNPTLKTDIEQAKAYWLLPDQKIKWITNDERQQKWINQRIFERTNFALFNSPPNLTGRDFTIALIDVWLIDKNLKETTISEIARAWEQHTQSDKIFKWFDDQDEIKKTSLAWEIIQKRHPFFANNQPTKNLQDLIIFFDTPFFSLPEKILTIEAVKKAGAKTDIEKSKLARNNIILSFQTRRSGALTS